MPGCVLRGANQRGSALLATLCFAAVLSLALSSYLAVCYRSLVMSNRNMHSTHSIELAEVGMEEALWALNNNVLSSNQVDPAAWAATGWAVSGGTQSKSVTGFAYENGATGQVDITVENYASPSPRITVVGRMTLGDHSTITRTLQSDTRRSPLFTNAIGAIGNLAFNLGGTVDSYTAADPLNPATYSYGFSAVVSGANVDIGSASVYGYATTKGTALQNLSGAKVAGSLAATGIDPTRVSTNASQPLFDALEPSIGGGSGPITSSTTFPDGSYRVDSIDLPDGEVITISGAVRLKVTNSVRTSGSGSIVITSGSSLQLQIDESDGFGLVLQGSGIVNQTRQPRNLSVLVGGNYPGNPTSSINVTNDFYGSIYLPRDDVTVASNAPIFGAVIAKSITFTASTPQFHYDPGLQNFSADLIKAPISLVQLRELSPTGL